MLPSSPVPTGTSGWGRLGSSSNKPLILSPRSLVCWLRASAWPPIFRISARISSVASWPWERMRPTSLLTRFRSAFRWSRWVMAWRIWASSSSTSVMGSSSPLVCRARRTSSGCSRMCSMDNIRRLWVLIPGLFRRSPLPSKRPLGTGTASGGTAARRGWTSARPTASPAGRCRCPGRPLGASHTPWR